MSSDRQIFRIFITQVQSRLISGKPTYTNAKLKSSFLLTGHEGLGVTDAFADGLTIIIICKVAVSAWVHLGVLCADGASGIDARCTLGTLDQVYSLGTLGGVVTRHSGFSDAIGLRQVKAGIFAIMGSLDVPIHKELVYSLGKTTIIRICSDIQGALLARNSKSISSQLVRKCYQLLLKFGRIKE